MAVLVHIICFNDFSKGNYWHFLRYFIHLPYRPSSHLPRFTFWRRRLNVEVIIRFCFFFMTKFNHFDKFCVSTIGFQHETNEALLVSSTWSRWMSHWRTMHFQTQLVHQNTASGQKLTEEQAWVSSNWSGLFQHDNVHVQMCLQVQLQLLSCQKNSGGQSLLFAYPILSNGVENTCIADLIDFWKKWLPSPWVKFLRNLGTLWRHHPRKHAGT